MTSRRRTLGREKGKEEEEEECGSSKLMKRHTRSQRVTTEKLVGLGKNTLVQHEAENTEPNTSHGCVTSTSTAPAEMKKLEHRKRLETEAKRKMEAENESDE